MADNETSRLSRLTAIITLLQTKRLLTATEISERFSISTRTVYRDIRALEEAGIPVCTEEGKGYSLMQGYKLPPVMFTENEANALITAEQLIMRNKDNSLVRHYSDAINKIKSVLRYETKSKADLLSRRIFFSQNMEHSRTSDLLSVIQLAITHYNVACIVYHTPEKDEITSRQVEPFALYSTQENWIMIAWCRLRKDYRAFRLDRIKEINILAETFEEHEMTLSEYFRICEVKYQEKKFQNP